MNYSDIQVAIRLKAVVESWREFLEQLDACEPDTQANIVDAHAALDRVIHAKEPWGLQNGKQQ